MKKLNIMLGCLLIASGTLSACSYYDGSVERKPGSAVTPTVNCEQNTDCNIANHEECVVCTGQHVTDGVCTKTEEMICLKQLDSGMGCSRNAECKAGLCIATDEAGGICNCLDEASCGGGACAKIEKISTEANVCLVAKNGNPCIKDTLNCGEGLECVNNICQPKNPNDVVTPKENGVACTADTECKSGNCKSGICADKGGVDDKKGEVGAVCKTENDCVAGLICKDSKCAEKSAIGDDCTKDAECESERCSGNKCVKVVAKGGTCDEELNLCDGGLKCEESVCIEKSEAEKAERGEECLGDADCKGELVCQFNKSDSETKTCWNKCNKNTDCADENTLFCEEDTNKCLRRAQIEASCKDLPCIVGSFCNADEICVENGTTGDKCSAAKKCKSGFGCSKDGVCIQAKNNNESCTEDAGCKSNYCYINDSGSACAQAGTIGYKCSTDSNCAEGYACSSGKTCIKINDIGGECTEDAGCKGDNVCDLSTMACSIECTNTAACPVKGKQICEAGVCRNIVPCPNDTSKQCMIALRLTPNLQWNYGQINDNWIQSTNGDYYGNIFTLSLPDATYGNDLDFCARVLTAFYSFVDDNNETHIDDPIDNPKAAWLAGEEYKCKEIPAGKNFVEQYPDAMNMLLFIGTQMTKDPLNAYALAIVDYMFRTASYVKTENGKESEVHPFPNGIKSLVVKVTDKSMTCDEYLAFYKQFGYDFEKIFESPYVSTRMKMPCIELSLGKVLPFTLKYRKKDSKWLNHDMYFAINLFPSPLMLMSDKYNVGMAPSYISTEGLDRENNFDVVVNYTQGNSYLSACTPDKGGIAANGCVRPLISKYEIDRCSVEDEKKCDGESEYKFNVIATYTKDKNNFSCDDKFTRVGTCPSSAEQTLSSHSNTKDCGVDNLNENKLDYPDCVPTLAINALNFSVYVEVNDDDFKD